MDGKRYTIQTLIRRKLVTKKGQLFLTDKLQLINGGVMKEIEKSLLCHQSNNCYRQDSPVDAKINSIKIEKKLGI